MKNWWYYHKWYVIFGCILLAIVTDLLGNKFGWFQKTPDVQIAYVGENPLPDDTVKALEQAFSTLIHDFNGDGEIIVRINQYARSDQQSTDADTAQYRQASEISLIGDINDCESYFFLMNHPENLQKEFQILAMPDGSCPEELDFSIENKVFQWNRCPLLSEMNLGNYTLEILGEKTAGTNQEILQNLYLGRRCFYNEKRCDNEAECEKLWEQLKGDTN